MNNYLLIDFGASFVKSTIYDKLNDSFNLSNVIKSPLYTSDILNKKIVFNTIIEVLNQYQSCDAIVMCSILGGYWENDAYYSWKVENKFDETEVNNTCLLSELFSDQPTYHVHKHHFKESDVTGLKLLGYINKIKCYSSLGDTNCVIESVDLKNNDLLINIGTGSQIISKNNKSDYNLISYIPSGRALTVFKLFFDSMGIDLFSRFNDLKIKDLEQSTLYFDLNVFPQSYRFNNNGGFINNIFENNFNIDNIISSLFKSYLNQYIEIITSMKKIEKIWLTGGISRKYDLIPEYINYKTIINVVLNSAKYEDTHIGMSKMIKKYI